MDSDSKYWFAMYDRERRACKTWKDSYIEVSNKLDASETQILELQQNREAQIAHIKALEAKLTERSKALGAGLDTERYLANYYAVLAERDELKKRVEELEKEAHQWAYESARVTRERDAYMDRIQQIDALNARLMDSARDKCIDWNTENERLRDKMQAQIAHIKALQDSASKRNAEIEALKLEKQILEAELGAAVRGCDADYTRGLLKVSEEQVGTLQNEVTHWKACHAMRVAERDELKKRVKSLEDDLMSDSNQLAEERNFWRGLTKDIINAVII